eukprot:4598533-Pleurochrysis_carterae.AAC.2
MSLGGSTCLSYSSATVAVALPRWVMTVLNAAHKLYASARCALPRVAVGPSVQAIRWLVLRSFE